jgi:hypothetical protein
MAKERYGFSEDDLSRLVSSLLWTEEKQSLLVDERASARIVDVGIYAGVDYWRAHFAMETYPERAAGYSSG